MLDRVLIASMAAAYYCTNNSKTDYNFTKEFDAGWHESSGKAH